MGLSLQSCEKRREFIIVDGCATQNELFNLYYTAGKLDRFIEHYKIDTSYVTDTGTCGYLLKYDGREMTIDLGVKADDLKELCREFYRLPKPQGGE